MSSTPLPARLPASWRPPRADNTSAGAPAAGSASPPAASGATLPRWTTPQLFGSSQEVLIEHQQAVYRLRITSLGKLILTK